MSIKNNKHAIIIGAGITGLACAWKLCKAGYKITIIEKESFAGGLSATHDWDGWKFDYGAHNFFTKHEEIVEFYKSNLPYNFSHRQINVKLHIFNKLITYPLLGIHVFYVLPPLLMLKAGINFFFSRIVALIFGINYTERLDEWIIRRFGKALYKIYFEPYLERVQKINPKYLSKDIGEKKIPVFSIRQYLIREVTKNKIIHPDDITFWGTYYFKKGFGKMTDYFYNNLMKNENVTLLLNEKINTINTNSNNIISIETEKRIISAQNADVISTIPLNTLIRFYKEMIPNFNKGSFFSNFEYTKMRFFLIKTNRDKIMGYNWTNFNNSRYPYYRVSESLHDQFEMTPINKCSLTFEIPLNEEDELWKINDESLLKIILPLFNEVFQLKSDEIIDCKSLYIDNANPRMNINYKKKLSRVFSSILKFNNLYSIGRQGLFTYINADGCTKMGFNFAQAIIENTARREQKILLKQFHQIEILN